MLHRVMHGGWKVSFPRVKPSHLNVTCCHGDGLIGLSRSSKEPVKRIVSSVISRLCCRLRVRHETCPHMAAGFFQISIRHAFPAFRLTFWIKRTCFFFLPLFQQKFAPQLLSHSPCGFSICGPCMAVLQVLLSALFFLMILNYSTC